LNESAKLNQIIADQADANERAERDYLQSELEVKDRDNFAIT